ncbi:MAG: response regulator transcription factor [Oscillospiraceae bacterium]|nr:response regulator transcription factor [Eubacteriales bacterium]MDY2618850.1 response regulator transcription factor [Oscillospiraceae bacterium]
MLIYILEDDEQILEMMTYALQSSDYEVAGFQSAFALYQQLSQRLPSLILLDLMLPDEDGLTVLKKLRSDPIYQDLRIIIVSAKSSELDKVRGLDLGADDYLTKPFGIMELISRVKAQLRRVPGSASLSPLLSCGSLTLNPATREVFCGQEPITLTYKEFELLELLMQHPGQVLSRNIIMDRVWGYDFEGTSRTLDMHIRTLRQKLGEQGKMVQTIRNVGYKLECSS